MFTLRPATPAEHPLACSFLAQARAYQREQGFVQWTENTPNADTLLDDIQTGRGFFFCEDGTPIGYVFLDPSGEPAYETLTEGAWQCNAPYLTVHRVAFGAEARGKGASRHLFACIRDFAVAHGLHVLRMDTHRDNKLMQHVLAREGFVCCGVVHYDSAERLVFEHSF